MLAAIFLLLLGPIGQAAPLDHYNQILSMQEDSVLPYEFFQKVEINALAEALVYRIHLIKDEKISPQAAYDYDFLRDTEIHMGFKSEYLSAILHTSSGCFKNVHQVGTSGGINDGYRRSRAENYFLRLELENEYDSRPQNIVHELRPKYAYLMHTKSRQGHIPVDSYKSKYGNIIAVFRDSIKSRTSFSEADSLDAPFKVKSLLYRSPNRLRGSSYYWEAQIWGTACIGPDVEYFLVNCPYFQLLTEKEMALLRSTGKKIYQCRYTPRQNIDSDEPITDLNRGESL